MGGAGGSWEIVADVTGERVAGERVAGERFASINKIFLIII